MTLLVPYETSGQELGETRLAMGRTLMKDLEKIIDKFSSEENKYYVLFHAKPWPNHPNIIKIKPLAMHQKPPMMLSCILFGVDNKSSTLTLEWALPGSWPTWSVGGTNEPIPEVIGNLKELSKTCDINKIIAY